MTTTTTTNNTTIITNHFLSTSSSTDRTPVFQQQQQQQQQYYQRPAERRRQRRFTLSHPHRTFVVLISFVMTMVVISSLQPLQRMMFAPSLLQPQRMTMMKTILISAFRSSSSVGTVVIPQYRLQRYDHSSGVKKSSSTHWIQMSRMDRFHTTSSLFSSSTSRRSGTTTTSSSTGSKLHSTSSNKEEMMTSVTAVSDATETLGATSTSNERLSAKGLSLDIKTITNHYDIVYSHMMSRNPANTVALNAIQRIANTAKQRTTLIQQRDTALNERRTYSDQIGALLRQQKKFLAQHKLASDVDVTTIADTTLQEQYQQMIQELEVKMKDSNRVAAVAEETEEQLNVLQTEMDDQLSILPNLLDDQVPVGRDEADNEVIHTHGDIYTLPQRLGWPAKYCSSSSSSSSEATSEDSWKPAWHDDIATRVDGYMSDAAVQMSGSRFIALRADIAQLERAIGQWMLDLHTSSEHNYVEVSVPYVVSRSTLVGTGQLPKFEEDLFAITTNSHTCNGEDAFLIPTAEVPITNLHRNEVLNEEDLPISYVALTPCFRAEAGSYGRDTKGLIRTHQFQKVELVKITSATTSQEQHELLTSHAEKCLQLLELPYRKVRLCSGDIGFSANHCYDLEVYLPGSQEYREISSCSNTGDFQARRLALRYRPKPIENTESTKGGGKAKKGGNKVKPVLCHTINGSGLAVGRTLVAILENYQRPDGSIVIPEVLRPYMKGKEVILKPSSSPAEA